MKKDSKLTISICFEEDSINDLFSALLRSRGVKTRIISSFKEIDKTDIHSRIKVITEPQFASEIPEDLKHDCLVVGNKESLKGISGITLSRPLTEQKIETAIESLLN
jgi:hypothetical protein